MQKSNPMRWIDIPRSPILEGPSSRNNNIYTKNTPVTYDLAGLDKSQLSRLLIPPMDHQKTLIKAMIDVENEQTIKIRFKNSEYIVQSRACILSDKPGSGKSYSIIALILLNPKLPTLPIFMEDDMKHINNNVITTHAKPINNVIRTPKTILPINLIFVSKNVMTQWVEYIERFSEGLGITIIDKFSSAKKVIEDYAKNKKYFANIDIVLIKNDKVNSKKGKINHPALIDKSMENKSMVEIFSDLINGSDLIVNRVILDDFDSLLIPSQTKIIPAIFTWFVSATKGKYRHINEKNVYNNILENSILTTYFNINTDPKFLEESVKFCDVRVRQYLVVDNLSRYRNGIVQLNGNFSELVNSNSYAEIGNRLKITKETINICDIFEKMYENEFKAYKKIKVLDQRLSRIHKYYREVLVYKPPNKISNDVLNYLKQLISEGNEEELKVKWTDFSHDVLEKYINTVIETTKKNLEQKTISIKRVVSNFQEGTCPITFEDLKDSEISILKCCGVVLSREGLNSVRNGLCPACRKPIENSNILDISNVTDIVIEEDITKIEIEENTENVEESTRNLTSNELEVDDLIGLMSGSITSDIPYNSPDIAALTSNKENSVLKLITQDNPNIEQVGEYYKVFGGGEYSTLENKKFIIFASSIDAIRSMIYENPESKKGNRFVKNNISYAELKGMHSKTAENIKRYRLPNSHPSSIKVLIITSKSQAFAGLDLQCTTDIIFLNRIKDPNIEKQMIGRALRLGRTNKLDIHYLMFNNEVFNIDGLEVYF